MTRRNQWGESIDVASLGAGLVRAFPAGRAATPPVEWRKFCFNDKAPSAQFQNQLHAATNQAVVQRTRQIFTAIAWYNNGPLFTDTRFRFAFRTGSYHSQLVVFATMQPPPGASGDSPSYSRLKIFSDTAEAVTVKTTDFYYGASPLGYSLAGNKSGWSFSKTVRMYIAGLSPDTDYYGLFSQEADGTLHTATVIEMQSMTEHHSGYLPTNLNQDSEVLSVHRQKVATIQKNLWKNSGRSLINFTVSDGTSPLTNATGTSTNIVDNSSTAVSASTPGYTLDMRYRDRLMQTSGIPVKMAVFCKSNVWVGDPSNGIGRIRLLDSGGTAVLTIADGLPATGGWVTTTGYLPATTAKYDLHFDNNGGGTITLYAVSIYEYET